MTLCRCASGSEHCKGLYVFTIRGQSHVELFEPEVDVTTILRNIGDYALNVPASCPRGLESSAAAAAALEEPHMASVKTLRRHRFLLILLRHQG